MRCNKARQEIIWERYHGAGSVVPFSLQAGNDIFFRFYLTKAEVCALTWEDVDLKNMVIHVRHTIARIKTDANITRNKTVLVLDTPKTMASTRDIPISTTLLPVLVRLSSLSSRGFLLSGSDLFVKPRTFEYHYHKMLDKFNISSVNFHVLRHTFATRCIEAGVDVKSLSEILGHANVSITLNTYVHSSMEMKRNQLEKLLTLSA